MKCVMVIVALMAACVAVQGSLLAPAVAIKSDSAVTYNYDNQRAAPLGYYGYGGPYLGYGGYYGGAGYGGYHGGAGYGLGLGHGVVGVGYGLGAVKAYGAYPYAAGYLGHVY